MRKAGLQGQSIFARLAVPYTFNPDLSMGAALAAVAGCLARIFLSCGLFAVWGGVGALAWTGIASHFWRAAAVLLDSLLFLAAVAILMIAMSAVERKLLSRS